MLSAILNGFGVGASLIIAIGAQNAHVMRQGLRKRYVFPVAGLCTLCDWVLIAVGAAGFGSLISRFPALTHVAAWGGAAFLLFYGGLSFKSAVKRAALETNGDGDSPVQFKSLRAVVAFTLAVSLLNPHVYLDTVVLLGGLAAQYPADVRVFFALGAMGASAIWFFGLGFGARLLEPLFKNPTAWRVLDMVIGVVMWSIAASLILGEWQTSKSLTTTRGGVFSGILSLREPVCLTLHQGFRPAEPKAPFIPPPPEVGAS